MELNSRNKHKNFIKAFLSNSRGNSMPLVMMVALVIMIIGGAVAYAAVQVFVAVRGEVHSQMTYFAAESALERSMCSLDSHITKENYAASKGIVFADAVSFITDVIDSLNNNITTNTILQTTEVEVYNDSSVNKAEVNIKYSWNGEYESIGLKKLKFPITITATAQMDNGILKSYGKQAVATREYEVWISDRFRLNGAAYTIGDLLATTTSSSTAESVIKGDIYVFGTGLDKAKRMEQYYNGGVCAINKAILKIEEGSVYTRNLVRAGTFDESDDVGNPAPNCAIIVDNDIVAQGIQIFGSNDSIVVKRDAYTFDDVELSGSNSFIAINGNYYGVNPGDGVFHDTSSAVINGAPRYYNGFNDGYLKSRIVINGDVFINGATFRIADVSTGLAGHKMEEVSLAWIGDDLVYNTEGIDVNAPTNDYLDALKNNSSLINGYSVILQHNWSNDGVDSNGQLVNFSNWEAWISEIRDATDIRDNSIANFPDKIKGFCNNAMAANERIYFIHRTKIDLSEVIKPASFSCRVSEDINNLENDFFDSFSNGSWNDWDVYAGNSGMPAALKKLMGILEDHVQVFARKKYDKTGLSDLIDYSYIPGLNNKTEFNLVSDHLRDNVSGTPAANCILRYEESDTASIADVVQDLKNALPSIDDKYFLVMNFNPDKVLHIKDKMNGIVFSRGKVVIEKDGMVNGAVIAAGRGYDPSAAVKGSAADVYLDSNNITQTRLPKFDVTDSPDANRAKFNNWNYAALVFENGGQITFPGRIDLLTEILNHTGYDLFNVF